MKKIFTATFLCFAAIAFGQGKQQRTVADFSGVSGATGIRVELTQGNENAVWVIASDDKYLEDLKTVVEKGVLRIYYKQSAKMLKKDKNRKLQAFVTYQSINRVLGSSGAGIVAINRITAPSLLLDFSSGARFTGEIKTNDLKIDQSSGAISTVSGIASQVKADVSSGGIFSGYDLNTETCKASASSGGILRIGVSGKLTGHASSGGLIHYKGDPEVERSVSSGGVVNKQ